MNYIFRCFSKIPTLCIGIILGIASQRIPEIKSQTDKVLSEFEQIQKNKIVLKPTKNKKTVYFSKSLDNRPISSFQIERTGYSLGYDARNKNPSWVYEHLTNESIKGTAERSNSDFKEDDTLPEHLRATLADYKGSGFDRGHIAPAANHKSSQSAMADTFFMSNMCPQCPQLNRGYWSKLEKHIRDLTKEYQNIYVVTGPLYLPYSEVDGKRYIKYQVIGKNDIAVPTHFFKIILLEDWSGNKETRAYILPNKEIAASTPLDNFKTTTQKVEKLAGLVFNKI